MESFMNTEQYQDMKLMYETTYFKLLGEYCVQRRDTGLLSIKPALQMKEFFKNKIVTIEYQERKGSTTVTKSISKSFYEIWSCDPSMKEYTEIIFNCDVNSVLDNQYNMFTGFNHPSPIEDDVNLDDIFEHIRSLVDYNEEEYLYVISWFAQMVQEPHILPDTCLVFISDEGVGKDLFQKFIASCIGEKYTANTDKLNNLCGTFNTMLSGKIFITVNETNPIESRDRQDNIKYIVTATSLVIEGKFKDPIICKNYCRLTFFSNKLFAFPAETGARRPSIHKSSKKHLASECGIEENHRYFKNLVQKYHSSKHQAKFLDYLKNYDISSFNPKAIVKSNLQMDLEENSISPIARYLGSLVRKNQHLKVLTIKTTDLYEEFIKFTDTGNDPHKLKRSKVYVEITQTYDIRKKVVRGVELFEIYIETLGLLLAKRYNWTFLETDKTDETEVEAIDFCVEIEENKALLLSRIKCDKYMKELDQMKQLNLKLEAQIKALESKVNQEEEEEVEYEYEYEEEEEEIIKPPPKVAPKKIAKFIQSISDYDERDENEVMCMLKKR